MSDQLTIEQLAASCGYQIRGDKSKKGTARLMVLSKGDREYRIDDELISSIIALGKPMKAPAGVDSRIKAVS